MRDELHEFRHVEAALHGLGESERAGVFAPTPLDTRRLLHTPSRSLVLRAVYRWGSIAAAIGLVLGIWRWSDLGTTTTATKVAMVSPCNGTFFGCVSGPRQSLGTSCGDFDYDRDGDIDMADFRTYQLECEGVTR